MVNTVKFSQFSAINKASTNQLVGLSGGANAISDLPIHWTTSTRPVAPANGFSGYNTTLSQWEYWNAVTMTWIQFSAGGSGLGTVTAIATGTGLVGGIITTTGTISLIVPVVVALGGTGNTSMTPFSVICGGTSGPGAFQSVAGVGSAGQVFTSNGAGLLPSWQTASSSGAVSPGSINQLAWYAANGSTVSGLATALNSVLITSAGGVPMFATTLPSGLTLVASALGTPISGTLTNCTGYILANLVDTAWVDISGTIGVTGFSVGPTITAAKYKKIGRTVFLNILLPNGTSNATTFTITNLPFTCATATEGDLANALDNSTSTYIANWTMAASSTTIVMINSNNPAGWTASGLKGVTFQGFYEATS